MTSLVLIHGACWARYLGRIQDQIVRHDPEVDGNVRATLEDFRANGVPTGE